MNDQSPWLIVGLGNPGPKYELTYHNCGWIVLDSIAEDAGIRVDRIKFNGLYGSGSIEGEKVILLKPTTYMNNSGECVRRMADYFKIPPEKILVIYDDIDLKMGELRIRHNGGPGTHNGMRSVVSHLGNTDFPRFRVGIGPKPPRLDIVDYVLMRMTDEHLELLNKVVERSIRGIRLMLKRGLEFAMNKIHSEQKKEECEKQKALAAAKAEARARREAAEAAARAAETPTVGAATESAADLPAARDDAESAADPSTGGEVSTNDQPSHEPASLFGDDLPVIVLDPEGPFERGSRP